MVLCLFYKLVNKQHHLVWFGQVCGLLLWFQLKPWLGQQLRTRLGLQLGHSCLDSCLSFFLISCLDLVQGFLQGFCFSSFNSCLVAGFNLGLHIGLNSFLNIVGFLVGFCLNMGQNWPGLKLPLVPQLRPRHGGFLASFYFLSSNVVFCFTCCFFCCFSTALASFSNMRQKNGFTLKEWGSSNSWYFRLIHLYLKNQA